MGGGGGAIRPPPVFFLPFTQKILWQPIPENILMFPTFYCGCPYEKKNQKFCFKFFEKGQILRSFSGLAPSKQKFFQDNLRVGYVNIEKSFDAISMWVMGFLLGIFSHSREG